MTNEKAELETELLPVQSEAASFRFRFNEAEKVRGPVVQRQRRFRLYDVLTQRKNKRGKTCLVIILFWWHEISQRWFHVLGHNGSYVRFTGTL